MFRRKWSGLPKDHTFPSTLKELGYFVNDEDEIRSIASPDRYFKFFIDRNTRINDRQRFHFNEAIQKVVHKRLEAQDLQKIRLPLGTASPSEPHLDIFASSDLAEKSRVVVLFGEPQQDLGNLALRVANGKGGIDKGTMVSVVRTLQKQASSASDAAAPGIILANVGSIFWWPEGKRALTLHSMTDMPLASLVHHGRRITPANTIPGSETSEAHIRYLFDVVFPAMVSRDAQLDLIGIGLAADMLEGCLDQEAVWDQYGPRINTITLLGSVTNRDRLKCNAFKTFLTKRSRAFVVSEEPLGTVLAGPSGNPTRVGFHDHGTAAVISSGEPFYTECIMIAARDYILGWVGEVAMSGRDYCHPEAVVINSRPEDLPEELFNTTWGPSDFVTSEDAEHDETATIASGVESGVANGEKETRVEAVECEELKQSTDGKA